MMKVSKGTEHLVLLPFCEVTAGSRAFELSVRTGLCAVLANCTQAVGKAASALLAGLSISPCPARSGRADCAGARLEPSRAWVVQPDPLLEAFARRHPLSGRP
jgi:hypothetical protein